MNQKASLKISQEVIETIAKVAALEIDGVADVVTPDNSFKGFLSQNFIKKPIEVKIADGVAEINIALSLEYGAKLAQTCRAVQKGIKDNVQTMTGIIVSKVNISVENISFKNKEVVSEEE